MSAELCCYARGSGTAEHEQFPLNQRNCYSTVREVVVVRHNYCISKSRTRLVSSLCHVFKEWRHLFITEALAIQQCQCGPTKGDYHIIGSLNTDDNWKETRLPTSWPVREVRGGFSDRMSNLHMVQMACLCKTIGKSYTCATLMLLLASGRRNMKGKGRRM